MDYVRVADGRKAEPTSGIIDSESVKTTEAGGLIGYDADGAPDFIERCRDAYPAFARFSADGGYAGQKLEPAIAYLDQLAIEIISRSDARASSSCPAAGWSSAPSPGATDADASPKDRETSPRPRHGSSSRPSGE